MRAEPAQLRSWGAVAALDRRQAYGPAGVGPWLRDLVLRMSDLGMLLGRQRLVRRAAQQQQGSAPLCAAVLTHKCMPASSRAAVHTRAPAPARRPPRRRRWRQRCTVTSCGWTSGARHTRTCRCAWHQRRALPHAVDAVAHAELLCGAHYMLRPAQCIYAEGAPAGDAARAGAHERALPAGALLHPVSGWLPRHICALDWDCACMIARTQQLLSSV